MNFKRLPDAMAESRKMACKCSCDIDFHDPCASCPLKKWKQVFCKKEQSFPSATKLISDFVSSAGSELKALGSGEPKLEPEESERRYSICENCEFFHAPSKRCKKCGCFLKWKTAWRSQKCPIGKW
jgi:hypothetical protein